MMFALWSFADYNDGTIQARIDTIAARAHVSQRTAAAAIKIMLEIGMITQEYRGGCGRGSNRYTIAKPYRILTNMQDVQVTPPINRATCTECSLLDENNGDDTVQHAGRAGCNMQDVHTNSTSLTVPLLSPIGDEKKTEEPTPKEKKYTFEEIDKTIVDSLERIIQAGYNDSWKLSNPRERHYADMRLLRENGNANIDGPVSIDRIRDVIKFLKYDSFWVPGGNIRSVSKFRERFDALEMRAKNDNTKVKQPEVYVRPKDW